MLIHDKNSKYIKAYAEYIKMGRIKKKKIQAYLKADSDLEKAISDEMDAYRALDKVS